MSPPTAPQLELQPERPRQAIRGERVALFGYAFDALTQEGLVDRIGELVAADDRGWIATLNVNLVCLAARSPAYREVLQSADVITADGMPIVWMSALRRRPLPARVTGSDLLLPLARRAADEGWRVFLAGGGPGVAEKVAEVLCAAAPGLTIAGTATPPLMDYDDLLASDENVRLVDTIRRADADVLLVALGSPKQERWIAHHLEALDVPAAVGVGAAFDFLAGRQARAPRWMRKSGLEWLYRMVATPRRLIPRYGRDGFTFLRLCLGEFLGRSR